MLVVDNMETQKCELGAPCSLREPASALRSGSLAFVPRPLAFSPQSGCGPKASGRGTKWNGALSNEQWFDDGNGLLQLNCGKECNCIIKKMKEYKSPDKKYKNYCTKSGMLMYSESGKILVVQSRGRLWGAPKGSVENNESLEQCAVRELFEETGIKMNVGEIWKKRKAKKLKHGFYFEVSGAPESKVSIMDKFDSTGGGWINLKCLKRLEKRGILRFNADFKSFLNEK
jgi:hypothetical protein